MKNFSLLLIAMLLALGPVWSQQQDSTEERQVPTGIKLGGILPTLSYNSDVGFRYGVLVNFYDWGDGSLYPDYLRKLYLEASKTTKGSGQILMEYDDKAFLGKNLRFLGNIGYYIEQALDFYGFNGYEAVYNSQWEDPNSPQYITKMFYRLDRRIFRVLLNFDIPVVEQKFRAYTGIGFFNFKLNSVDVDKMNEGKPQDQMLPSPDTVPGLYEWYRKFGIISDEEAHGGKILMAKAGAIYDTRDNEAMPNKGIWAETILIGATDLAHSGYSYLQLTATFRNYLSIFPKRLIFAYRLAWSQVLAGRAPFYMLPWYYSTKFTIQDGFGGAKTVRGILRDRIIADGVAFSNFELRWRVLNTKIFNQDFYIALSAFTDMAVVTKRHEYQYNFNVPPTTGLSEEDFFNFDPKLVHKPHIGVGGGIRFALNESFIVALDYGKALNPQDGSTGLYIGLDWLF